jgi:hypothetical protein
MQFYVDDTAVATADYGAATDYKPAHTGERPIKVAIRRASDLTGEDPGYQDIGESESYDFQGPTDYTLVTSGTVAQPRQFLITGTSREAVEDNKIEYQVLNAATGLNAALDVYITAPGAGVQAPQRVKVLALGESSDKATLDLPVASGAKEDASRSTSLRLDIRSSGGTLIYRSTSITVAEQTRLLVVIGDNAGSVGAAPIKAFVIGGIAAGAATTLLNRDEPGEVRLANTSPNSGPIDLIVGSDSTNVFAPNVSYGEASPYRPLDAATYNSVSTPNGNAGVFLFVSSLTVTSGRSFTLYGQGPIDAMRGLFLADDRRSVPTEAHIRFLYTANTLSGEAVDIYLVPTGTALDLEGTDADKPAVSGLGYRAASTQIVVDGGHYDAYVIRAGSTGVLLGPVELTLPDGTVQTLALTTNPSLELQLTAFNDARE